MRKFTKSSQNKEVHKNIGKVHKKFTQSIAENIDKLYVNSTVNLGSSQKLDSKSVQGVDPDRKSLLFPGKAYICRRVINRLST